MSFQKVKSNFSFGVSRGSVRITWLSLSWAFGWDRTANV